MNEKEVLKICPFSKKERACKDDFIRDDCLRQFGEDFKKGFLKQIIYCDKADGDMVSVMEGK